MTQWLNGGGFYLVHAKREYSLEELNREMDELEIEIQAAERYWSERKGRSA